MKIVHFSCGALMMALLVFSLNEAAPAAQACSVFEAKKTLKPYLPRKGCLRVLGKWEICRL